jgi:hypothetical protein
MREEIQIVVKQSSFAGQVLPVFCLSIRFLCELRGLVCVIVFSLF